MSRSPRWSRRGAALLLGLLLAVLINELLLQLIPALRPRPVRLARAMEQPRLFQPNAELVTAYRPGLDEHVPFEQGRSHRVRTVELPGTGLGIRHAGGFEDVWCLAIGDSFTFGQGVDDHEPWPQRLQQRVGRNVVNLGVSGYSTHQALELLRAHAHDLHPEVVVYNLFCNDHVDNLRHEWQADWLRRVEARQDELLTQATETAAWFDSPPSFTIRASLAPLEGLDPTVPRAQVAGDDTAIPAGLIGDRGEWTVAFRFHEQRRSSEPVLLHRASTDGHAYRIWLTPAGNVRAEVWNGRRVLVTGGAAVDPGATHRVLLSVRRDAVTLQVNDTVPQRRFGNLRESAMLAEGSPGSSAVVADPLPEKPARSDTVAVEGMVELYGSAVEPNRWDWGGPSAGTTAGTPRGDVWSQVGRPGASLSVRPDGHLVLELRTADRVKRVRSPDPIVIDGWTEVAASLDTGHTVELFRNGESLCRVPLEEPLTSMDGARRWLLAGSHRRPFVGRIRDVRLDAEVLTAEELATTSDATPPAPATSRTPIARWSMDDADPFVFLDSVTGRFPAARLTPPQATTGGAELEIGHSTGHEILLHSRMTRAARSGPTFYLKEICRYLAKEGEYGRAFRSVRDDSFRVRDQDLAINLNRDQLTSGYFRKDDADLIQEGVWETERLLKEMAALCESRGTRLLVTLPCWKEFAYLDHVPTDEMPIHDPGWSPGWHWRRVEAFCRIEGIPVLSLGPSFRDAARQGRALYFETDGHWNAEGHELAAELIAAQLDEMFAGESVRSR